jgi:hypothetical protein
MVGAVSISPKNSFPSAKALAIESIAKDEYVQKRGTNKEGTPCSHYAGWNPVAIPVGIYDKMFAICAVGQISWEPKIEAGLREYFSTHTYFKVGT